MGELKVGEAFNPYKEFNDYDVPDCILECPELTHTEKFCWSILMAYTNDNCIASISQKELAEIVCVSRRQILNILKSLEDKKFIRRTKIKDGGPLFYQLLWHPIFEKEKLKIYMKEAIGWEL